MLFPYNPDWIRNRHICRQALRWHRQNRLTDTQLTAVQSTYPVGFRASNYLSDIGLFLFTLVVVVGVFLLIALLDRTENQSGLSLGFGLVVLLINERLIPEARFYRNGVDNALILSLTGLIGFGLSEWSANDVLFSSYIKLLLMLLVVWRYGDLLITGLTVLFSYFIIVNQWANLFGLPVSSRLLLLTCLGISWSILLYAGATGLHRWLRPKPRLSAYYADALTLTKWLIASFLLVITNTFGQRSIWPALLPGETDYSHSFTTFTVSDALLTFALPLLFTAYGCWKKDRLFLILGLVGLVAGIATARFYWNGWPRSVYLSTFGAALIGLAIAGIRTLKTTRWGFTDTPDDAPDRSFPLDLPTISLIQTSTGLLPNDDSKLQFGGGDFGGGGAGGDEA